MKNNFIKCLLTAIFVINVAASPKEKAEADALFDAKQYSKALSSYEAAEINTKEKADAAWCRFRKGLCLLRINRKTDALIAFEQLRFLYPASPLGAESLQIQLDSSSQESEKKSIRAKLLKNYPESPQAKAIEKSQIRTESAAQKSLEQLMAAGFYEEALTQCDKLIRDRTSDKWMEATFQRGVCLCILKRNEEAIASWKPLLVQPIKSEWKAKALLEVSALYGKKAETHGLAINTLRQLIEEYPNDANRVNALYELASLLYADMQMSLAKNYFLILATDYPNHQLSVAAREYAARCENNIQASNQKKPQAQAGPNNAELLNQARLKLRQLKYEECAGVIKQLRLNPIIDANTQDEISYMEARCMVAKRDFKNAVIIYQRLIANCERYRCQALMEGSATSCL